MKLAITLRHLATGESYQSLSFQFRVGKSTICKFVPQVCEAIRTEFLHEYLRCPNNPDDWKDIERDFRTRWNVPNAIGALDGKFGSYVDCPIENLGTPCLKVLLNLM